jgi:hypothetical protein
MLLDTLANIISALLQALREGAVAERACEIAADKIHNAGTVLLFHSLSHTTQVWIFFILCDN